MASDDTNTYLENFGRSKYMEEPVSVDHIFPEIDGPVSVGLTVVRTSDNSDATSKDLHWMIQWLRNPLESAFPPVCRLQVVREKRLRDSEEGRFGEHFNHLTNWGPITVTSKGSTLKDRNLFPTFEIKTMSKEERNQLADIAARTPVRVPDGQWNCQDWTKTVLETAVSEGLIDRNDYDCVIAGAESVEPLIK